MIALLVLLVAAPVLAFYGYMFMECWDAAFAPDPPPAPRPITLQRSLTLRPRSTQLVRYA